MSDSEYFRSQSQWAHERCMAYRRAMSDASDEADVFFVLCDAAEDPLVSLSAFAQLFDYGQFLLVAFRTVHSDK